MIGENVFQAAIEFDGGESAGEEGRDAGSWDDEDVFVHGREIILVEMGRREIMLKSCLCVMT